MSTQAETDAAAGIVAYQQAVVRVRTQLVAFITAVWRALGVYRNAQMAEFITQVTPVVLGAEQQMVSLTAAYLAGQRAYGLGVGMNPVYVDPVTVTGSVLRNGTSMEDVYSRPFHLVWRDIAAGQDARDAHYAALDRGLSQAEAPPLPADTFIDDAITRGLDRVVLTAVTDLQLAKTHTAREVMARDGQTVGYRRVLEGAYSCGLCIVASTVRYHMGDLLPIHPACDCSVSPIYGDHDPGRTINEQALADVHAAVFDRFGSMSPGGREFGPATASGRALLYRDLLVKHDHGEIGPVLGVRGQDFTRL